MTDSYWTIPQEPQLHSLYVCFTSACTVDSCTFLSFVTATQIKQGSDTHVIAETSAIATYIVAAHGKGMSLYRTDPLEIAHIAEIHSALEELSLCMKPSFDEPNMEKKKEMRRELVKDVLPDRLAAVEARICPDGYVVGEFKQRCLFCEIAVRITSTITN